VAIEDNPRLKALMAAIKADVVIRKRKDGSTAVENSVTRAKREARENGDPGLRALMRQSNLDVKNFAPKPDPYRYFQPIAKTALLQKQFCRCCENSQTNVIAEMLHLRGKTTPDAPIADVWVQRSTVENLPHEDPIIAPARSVEFCAECIAAASTTECWSKSRTNIEEATGQLPLIH
jgi:hypothetical protein